MAIFQQIEIFDFVMGQLHPFSWGGPWFHLFLSFPTNSYFFRCGIRPHCRLNLLSKSREFVIVICCVISAPWIPVCVHFFKTAEFTFQRLLLFFSSEWMVRPYVPLISDRKAIKYNSLVVGVLVFVLLSKSKAAKISSIQIELLELTWMKYFLGGENFEVILRCAMNRFKTLFFNW